MYNSRKRPGEELPQEMTTIWSCSDDACNGWMRDNFALTNEPVCILCKSPMVKEERMLPVLENTSPLQVKD